VITHHRSRRALAQRTRRMYEADAADELRDGEDVAPIALVVDDEPSIRQLVSTVLRHHGWSVIEAADGSTALTIAPEALDLLVTDYEMPSLSGLTLAEELREQDQDLPVLMVSGDPDAAHQVRSLAGRRTALVPKPFPLEDLVSTIGAIVD
jgi:two-component system OmpR family response regulator